MKTFTFKIVRRGCVGRGYVDWEIGTATAKTRTDALYKLTSQIEKSLDQHDRNLLRWFIAAVYENARCVWEQEVNGITNVYATIE